MFDSVPLLFGLPESRVLGERLALASNAEVGELSVRDFPDCETYVRLETDPSTRVVAVVGTLAKPNERILPLLFVAGAARQLGASSVGIVAPYLPYMRQDTAFHPGEAVTARLLADLIAVEADWLLTVDPHLHRIASLSDIYRIQATALHCTDAIATWIAANVNQPLIVGPDEESRQWASGIAAAARAPFVVLKKQRRGDEQVVITPPDLTGYEGRTPVLVDDIISTGRTMIAALRQLREQLPTGEQPVCVGVHALFGPGVHDALREAGAGRIVTTNTIPHSSNGIDIVPSLGIALAAQWRRLTEDGAQGAPSSRSSLASSP